MGRTQFATLDAYQDYIKGEEVSAVILLSGGIDSSVTAYIAKRKDKKKLYALTFLYGQRHNTEVMYAAQQALNLGIKPENHKFLQIPLDALGGSSLVGNGEIPVEGSLSDRTQGMQKTYEKVYGGSTKEIPSTWVPQRNSIFLTLGFAYAETVGADLVYIGTNTLDYSGYPDCKPQFLQAMEKSLNLASKRFVEEGKGIGIVAPLMKLTKAQIIQLGQDLEVDFRWTWSCYKGEIQPCGKCDSCRIRAKGFEEAGLEDPLLGVQGMCNGSK